MKRVYEILEDQSEDRYIFVQYNKGKIIGLNFHQGLGHIDYNYFTLCARITKIYNVLDYKETIDPSEQRMLINRAIYLYIDLFINN